MNADYVIVGAGSAGCVLANRLSENPGTRVVVIEAGGRDWNPLIHIPAGYMKLLDHPTITWGYTAEADPGTNGRAIPYPRGRVLGGSSSINGMIYVRGQPEDFDYWGQLGNRGWSWDDVLPYFKKAESWERGEDEFHGQGGPLLTSHAADRPLLCQTMIEAGRQIGLEYHEDVNRLPPGAGDNIGWVQQTRRGRRRQSAARTYLRAAAKRPNLQIVTGVQVHRVRFDGTRAVGVEFARNGSVERVVCVARGDPGRRRDRLAASAAIVGGRRPRSSRPGRHRGATCAAGRRQEFPGPLHRPRRLLGHRRQDPQRKGARPAFCRRGAALSVHRHRHADLCLVLGVRLGQGLGGIGDPRCAVSVFARQLRAGTGAPARRQTRNDGRHVADAALVAGLCRGQVAEPGGAAGDQPALPRRGHRPARRDRRAEVGTAAVRARRQ